MRQFKFLPGYYEWHLYDKETNQLLHVMADPVEELVYEDENGDERDITPEELHWLCYNDLECADSQYQEGEEYNGLTLSDIDRLDEQEMAEAADVMFNALTDYYI